MPAMISGLNKMMQVLVNNVFVVTVFGFMWYVLSNNVYCPCSPLAGNARMFVVQINTT